ncbi:hypothetical protein DUNSADRAFT_4000, partial [Dunaliella salina]
QTSANGADTIVRRQVRESELLSLDAMEDVNHENDRWQFMWALVRLYLHKAMIGVRGCAPYALCSRASLHAEHHPVFSITS